MITLSSTPYRPMYKPLTFAESNRQEGIYQFQDGTDVFCMGEPYFHPPNLGWEDHVKLALQEIQYESGWENQRSCVIDNDPHHSPADVKMAIQNDLGLNLDRQDIPKDMMILTNFAAGYALYTPHNTETGKPSIMVLQPYNHNKVQIDLDDDNQPTKLTIQSYSNTSPFQSIGGALQYFVDKASRSAEQG